MLHEQENCGTEAALYPTMQVPWPEQKSPTHTLHSDGAEEPVEAVVVPPGSVSLY